FDGLLNESVGRGVAFLLLPEPQAQQDTQPIRVESQDRIGLAEEENLFRPRLTNPRKLLKGFLGLGEWQLEYGAQVAVKLLKSDLRTFAELLGKLVGQDSVAGHFEERLVGCRENRSRSGADPLLEGLKCFPASVVVSEVGDVFAQDNLPRTTPPRHIRLAVVGLKVFNDLR